MVVRVGRRLQVSSFTKALILRKARGNKWLVEEDFSYYVGRESDNQIITVPKGFFTDLASIPRAFRWIIPQDGTYDQSSVLHDYLYHTKGYKGTYTKKECDQIFLYAMIVLGVKRWKRKLMYRSVRLAIWNNWEKSKK